MYSFDFNIILTCVVNIVLTNPDFYIWLEIVWFLIMINKLSQSVFL